MGSRRDLARMDGSVRLRVKIERGEPFAVWSRPVDVREYTRQDSYFRDMEPLPLWHVYELTFRADTVPVADIRSITAIDMPSPDHTEIVRGDVGAVTNLRPLVLRLTYDRPVSDFMAIAMADGPRAAPRILIDGVPVRTHDYCHHVGRLVPIAEHRRAAAQDAAARRRAARVGLEFATGPELDRMVADRYGVARHDPIQQFIDEVEAAEEAWAAGRPTLREEP
jgi:hypothetical protein